jgi:PKD repeat protein
LKPRIFTLLFVLLPGFLKVQYAVVGNTEECMNNISVYSVSGTPLPATYTWNVTGGNVVSTDGNGCVNTTEKCIEIIESPLAIITAYPGDVDCRLGGSIAVCLEQNALFFGNADLGNSGSPIVSWLWDFGDGTFSTHRDEVHSWLTPGTYHVTLTVTNACGCTGICYVTVEVDPVNGVNIECPTPICQGDTGKYYTDAVNCSSYNWVVTGGNILSPMPYGSSIQVECTGGSGNGILCLDNTNGGCGNYCPSETCVEIPIISTTSSIDGPTLVCKGSQTKYSVPAMTGCVYNWQITGRPWYNYFRSRHQRNTGRLGKCGHFNLKCKL